MTVRLTRTPGLLRPLFSLLVFSLLVLTAPARAATLTVINTNDSGAGSLRQAITTAASGDTITFQTGVTGTITLTSGELDVSQSVTLVGPGASALAVDGGGRFRVFAVTGGTVAISGLTIQNGAPPDDAAHANGSGGGVYNAGATMLTGCVLSGNAAVNFGGGVYNAGTLTLSGCTLSGNTSATGGGVYNQGAATLTACTLTGNSGGFSGGGVTSVGGSLGLTACTLTGNAAIGVGGVNNGGGTATLTDDILYGDLANGQSGGPTSELGGTVTATYCDVQGGQAGTGNLNAAPLFVSATDLHLQATSPCRGAGTDALATDLDGNPYGSPPTIGAYEIAGQSGAGYVVTNLNDSGAGSLRAAVAYADANANTPVTFQSGLTGTITLTSGELAVTASATITGPGASVLAVDGGGQSRVFGITGGTVAVSGLTIQNGTVPSSNGPPFNGNGGGVAITGGTVTLTACTFSGDSASNVGGGVFNGGMTALNDCTFTGNSALDGGGVYNYGTLTLAGCSLSGNVATGNNPPANSDPNGGGGVCNAARATLVDCTFTDDRAPDGGGVYNYGTITLTGCTLAGNAASSSGGGISSGGTVVLTGCTLAGNCAPNGGSGIYSGGGATLADDILYGDTGGNEAVNGSTFDPLTVTYCDVQGGIDGNDAANHVLNVDPQFVSAGDLHLQFTSPVIAQGTRDAPGFRANDHDGNPYALVPALGAYTVPVGPTATHLLWDNSDGRMAFWGVDANGSLTGLTGYGPYSYAADGPGVWHANALATGPDGTSYVLWNAPDGRVALWRLDAQGVLQDLAGYGPYTDDGQGAWSATAVSVGPDGNPHVLWNNTDGRVALWTVASDFTFTLAGYGPYTDDGQGAWSATALSTGPDGVCHILWNNTDNRVALWDVNPDFTFTLGGYGPYDDDSQPNAAQNKWAGTALSVGPDGLQHVLWGNTDGRAAFWDVQPDFGYTLLGGYGPLTDPETGGLWSVKALATGSDGTSQVLWGSPGLRAKLFGQDGSGNVGRVVDYGPYTDDSQPDAPQNKWQAVAVSAAPPPVSE